MKKYWYLLLFMILLIFSCRKEADVSWDTNWYGPVSRGTISMSHLIDDSLTQVQNSEVWLSFSRNIYSLQSDSLVSIPEDIWHTSIKLPFTLNILPGKKFLDQTRVMDIEAGSAELTEVSVEQGIITIELKSTYTEPVEYTFEFPDVTLNGQPLLIKEVVPPTTSGTQLLSKDYDIDGFVFDLTGENNDQYNTAYYYLKGRTLADADTLIVTPQDSFAFDIRFKELKLNGMQGYFGQRQVDFYDTSSIEILNSIKSGLIDIDSVDAHFRVENGVGADLAFTINELASINRGTGQAVLLQDPVIGTNIKLNRAVEQGNSINPSEKIIDLSSSNIEEFIENLPDKIIYDLSLKLNPMGNIALGSDFYDSDYPLKIDFEMNMPMKIGLEDLIFTEKLELDIAENNTLGSAELSIIFDNYFPLQAVVDLYTGPIDDQKRYKLITENNTISGGVPDSQGVVTSPAKSSIGVVLSKENLEKLKLYETIHMEVKMETTGLQTLQIYEHYKIDYQITGNFLLRVNAE